MCEITSENFYSELPAIEEAIRESAFVSLDLEFSKIHENIANPFTFFDAAEDRYYKLRQKVSDITCIQLGLAIFIHDTNSKTFKTKTYSFYTYPQTFYKSDSVVSFQTSCVEFLCKHKFDFNKLFYSRVPYLTDDQEKTIIPEMLDASFFDRYFETNVKFRSIEEELIKVLNIVTEWYDNAKYGENTFLEINGCNEPAYIILLQYYILKKLKYLSIDENQFGLTITKIKSNENSYLLNHQIYNNLKLSLLNKMMGIKYILRLISNLKKPIIGHNCALDILILSNQFFEPLPENFKEYQNFVSKTFGPIYDTKFISKTVKHLIPINDKWIGSSLSEIYSFFKDGGAAMNLDTIKIELVGIEESQDMKLHHAGWDAYYTGYCFIKMIHVIKNASNKMESVSLHHQRYTLTELLKSVENSKNKVYTYRSLTNSFNLESDDPHEQINYLVIQNKGMFYKPLDLKKLKHDLKQICNFDVKLLSKSTALIVTSFMNNRLIDNIKSKYWVEHFSHYQRRKKKQRLISLSFIIISTSLTVMIFLKK